MIKRTFNYLWHRIAGLRKDSEGFVVMSTLAIFLFIFVLCAFVYAVGETIHQKIRIQNACDAAAYSAAVVQADGLSRMAAVNRAMSWTYVQMTNRQMDYITYRWLKLTCKHFNEDKKNADDYHENIILAADKELGWWALLEAVVTGAVSIFFDLDCSGTIGNNKVVHVKHGEEGHGWWCGLEYGERTGHNLRLNHPKNEDFVDQLKTSGLEGLVDQFINVDRLDSVLSLLSFTDQGSGPSGWGELLGKWIDYDKWNIENMNKALVHINRQMTLSMKMTAESTLKSMLKDPRLPESKALKDYYINIHIPEGINPYGDDDDENGPKSNAPKSFFSPLHNTEAEEMLFLNMPSEKSASKTLLQHFPTLINQSNYAFGLDQWFIRGKGLYSDGKDHSYDSHPLSGVSFAKSKQFHYATMVRDEGMPGIQRVYKDANLNENGAGFLASNNKNSNSSDAVWRGNHLIDFMNFTGNITNAVKGFLGTTVGGGGDDDDDDAVSSEAELNKKMDELRKQEEEQGNMIGDLGDPLSAGKGTEGGAFSSQKSQMGNMESGMSKITNAITDALSNMLSNMASNFLDVHPSCENDTDLDYAKYPMCRQIENPTASLYSEYRWGSGKWFCLTKGFTYLICFAFDYPYIYCDLVKAKLKLKFGKLSTPIKVKVQGYGHLGWPKWFCGSTPKGFHVLPPLIPGSIPKSGKHGYMNSNYDLASGFVRPMKVLWGGESARTFSRDEYESCAMFFDGIADCATVMGYYTYPGLIRGHARIYGDDKEIYNNRYVGARCKPWVLNERFFAGDGTIVVGAAMKHTNPIVQLFNFWNSSKSEETQKGTEKTVLSAFNIPEGNYMWSVSAARAGVRHTRRNGEFDQERQYQITYDSICDTENLSYANGPFVLMEEDGNSKGKWISVDAWGGNHGDNPNAISRAFQPNGKKQNQIPIWNGCPCHDAGGKEGFFQKLFNKKKKQGESNERLFHDMWNLCETDWDATLLPVAYSAQKAKFYMADGSSEKDTPFNEQNYSKRTALIRNYYKAQGNAVDKIVGNGENWVWGSANAGNSFVTGGWKKANSKFYEDVLDNFISDIFGSGIASGMSGVNLDVKVPSGKKEKKIDVNNLMKGKSL